MNHTALLEKFIDLLETQSPLIPAAAWDTLPDLETKLETTKTDQPEDLARTIKQWAKPYKDLFAILRDVARNAHPPAHMLYTQYDRLASGPFAREM